VNAATSARMLARALINQGRLKGAIDLLAAGRRHIEGWPESPDRRLTLRLFLMDEARARPSRTGARPARPRDS
jgi:hypothetical protein